MEGFDYYRLYSRNGSVIDLDLQDKLRKVRLAVAGCGSTGGSFVDSMVRLGVESFKIADNGFYELENLNRQMVFLENLGKNKAEVYQQRILSINPTAQVKAWSNGFQKDMAKEFLSNVDLVFDAVDVTQVEAMRMKILLHELCHQMKIPVVSALDLGFMQYIRGYNYHLGTPILDGLYENINAGAPPLIQLLQGFISLDEIPIEMLIEIQSLLDQPDRGACQLGSACFLLSALMGPYLISFIEKKKLIEVLKVDLADLFNPKKENFADKESLLLDLQGLLNNYSFNG